MVFFSLLVYEKAFEALSLPSSLFKNVFREVELDIAWESSSEGSGFHIHPGPSHRQQSLCTMV